MNIQKYSIIVNRVSKLLAESCLLCESDESVKKELQEKLSKIKSKEDLKKFMKENADEIKENYKKSDEKTKSVLEGIWDTLCKAVKGTASFVIDHIGGILTLTGILYLGNKIGWKNIRDAITGEDPEAKAAFEKKMEESTLLRKDSIQAVNKVKAKLTPEQLKEVFRIRKELPDNITLDLVTGFWNWICGGGFFFPDRALNYTAGEMNKENSKNYTSEAFMQDLNTALDTDDPAKILEVIERGKAGIKKKEEKVEKSTLTAQQYLGVENGATFTPF